MSALRLLPLVALAAGAITVCGPPCFAQELEALEVAPDTAVVDLSPKAIETAEFPRAPSTSPDILRAPFTWGPDLAEKWGEEEARQAARVDPGILIYTEPPAGTDMPILDPPEHVDPEMILPNDP